MIWTNSVQIWLKTKQRKQDSKQIITTKAMHEKEQENMEQCRLSVAFEEVDTIRKPQASQKAVPLSVETETTLAAMQQRACSDICRHNHAACPTAADRAASPCGRGRGPQLHSVGMHASVCSSAGGITCGSLFSGMFTAGRWKIRLPPEEWAPTDVNERVPSTRCKICFYVLLALLLILLLALLALWLACYGHIPLPPTT